MMKSWRVCWNACPACSAPVTFGGGSTMQNGSRPGLGSEWNRPRSSHVAYHFASVPRGSYWGGMSVRGSVVSIEPFDAIEDFGEGRARLSGAGAARLRRRAHGASDRAGAWSSHDSRGTAVPR